MHTRTFVVAALGLAASTFAAERADVIEEIVVTAEKRETALMETPLAVSAFSAEKIENQQIYEPKKLEQFVPSMSYQESPGGAVVNLRGVGSDNTAAGGDAGVSMYVDGAVLGHGYLNASTMHNVERIEVLRGPQGTLYGRNATGGAINFIRKLPQFEPGGSIKALYGSDSRSLAEISGTGGLIDGLLAIRGTYTHEERDGYRTNKVTGNEIDDRNEDTADIALLFTPSERVEFVLRGDWMEREGSRPLTFYTKIPTAPSNLVDAGAQACLDDADCVYNVFDPKDVNRAWGVNGTLTWDISDDMTFKSISSFRRSKRSLRQDVDGTTATNLLYVPGYIEEADEISQEFDLTGIAFEGRLDWIAGLYYYDDDTDKGHALYTLPDLNFLLALVGPLADTPRLSGEVSSEAFFDYSLVQESNSIAVFGQGTYHLTDRLRFTAGARYTQDEKDGVQNHASNFVASINCPGAKQTESWSEVTGRVTLDFDLTDRVMLYGTVSKGYKAGGFSLSECGNSYDPEILWAYETGMKARFLDDRLHVIGAAYYYDYSDIQVRKFIENTALILNAAEAEIYGLEMEVHALFAGFELDGGFLVQHSEYKDFETLNATRGNVLQDVSGTQVQRAPDRKLSLGLEYPIHFGNGSSLTPRYEVTYTDDQHHDVFDDPWGRVDSYTLQNFRLLWMSPGQRWQVSGFVENLTDEEYLEYINPVISLGGGIGFWAPPRVAGVELRYAMLP